MGVDIHVYVMKHDKVNNKYEWLKIFNKAGELIPAYDARDHELFDELQQNMVLKTPFAQIPKDCFDEDFYKEYEDSLEWCYGFGCINLADLIIYLEKSAKNFDEERQSSLCNFKNRIENYIEFALDDVWNYNLSDIYILYWFDH